MAKENGKMDGFTLKDKARAFWMVKGHLGSKETIESSFNGYFKRLWYNEEAYRAEEGFEEAWEKWNNDLL